MDYYNQYNIKSTSDQKKSNHMNKITRILLSVSVFGFLISQSPLLFQSYENLVLDFFNFKIKLFTYTTERNCIFLLCNGILLLIIQSSGLIRKITPVISAARIEDNHEEGDGGNVKFQDKEKKGVGKDEILEEKTGENVDAQILEMEEEEEDEEEREEEEREEEASGMDVDELNKKCEDFIKKMKKLIQN